MREYLSKVYLKNSRVFDIGKIPVKLVGLNLKSKTECNKHQCSFIIDYYSFIIRFVFIIHYYSLSKFRND